MNAGAENTSAGVSTDGRVLSQLFCTTNAETAMVIPNIFEELARPKNIAQKIGTQLKNVRYAAKMSSQSLHDLPKGQLTIGLPTAETVVTITLTRLIFHIYTMYFFGLSVSRRFGQF